MTYERAYHTIYDQYKELSYVVFTGLLKLTDVQNEFKYINNKTEKEKKEIKREKRYNNNLSLIIFDIDNFKSVNDIYGHQMGDKVLQEFANILQSNSRKTDTVGRWGGEEFLIICSETEFDGILTQAEKLKEKVENFDFSVKEQKTASFGVSLYNKNESVKDMIKRADDALYEAKVTGKNRVKYK
ncbi:MAG: GGDEF domain-containing protein [Halarcobacter sp.]